VQAKKMKAGLRMASGKGGIDPAALAVASLAAAVSVIAPSGPYGPASMMIGLTILVAISHTTSIRIGTNRKVLLSARFARSSRCLCWVIRWNAPSQVTR